MKVLCVLNGGPMRKIRADGQVFEFEDHPYCGPTILKRNHEPRKHQPIEFLEAATRWAQQGRKVDEEGFCVWK